MWTAAQPALLPSTAARAALYRRRPAEELYDLEHDPYELVNLARVEQHEGERARLAQELERWMQSQGDRGRATELEAPESRVPASER